MISEVLPGNAQHGTRLCVGLIATRENDQGFVVSLK